MSLVDDELLQEREEHALTHQERTRSSKFSSANLFNFATDLGHVKEKLFSTHLTM